MKRRLMIPLVVMVAVLVAGSAALAQDEDQTRNVLKQGLLGAGVGAISSGASGGNAGQGALIGAGTSVIGSALLDALTTPSSSSSGGSGRTYRRSAPPPPQDEEYYPEDSPEEYYYYEEPAPQPSASQQILKQGLVGAGTGAIASSMSGGNAGKGALIGAGTSVIGNALLDTLTQPSQQRSGRVYRRARRPQPAPQQVQPKTTVQVQDESSAGGEARKKVIKKYDETGKLVSEEEVYY